MSQQQLSSRSGLTTGTLNKIELSRSSPTWPTLVAVAKGLQISLRDLAGLIEDEGDF